MARPFKQGLGYFPLDVMFFEDTKIRRLYMKHGYLGPTVYLRVLTLVYKRGYYLEISVNELAEQIFWDLRCDSLSKVDRVKRVIRALAECGLIDEHLMNNDVITSKAIQKQWLTCVHRRKKIETNKYWLLSDDDETSIKNFIDDCLV